MFNAKLQKAEAKLKLILLGDDRLTVIRRNPSTSIESNVTIATRFFMLVLRRYSTVFETYESEVNKKMSQKQLTW